MVSFNVLGAADFAWLRYQSSRLFRIGDNPMGPLLLGVPSVPFRLYLPTQVRVPTRPLPCRLSPLLGLAAVPSAIRHLNPLGITPGYPRPAFVEGLACVPSGHIGPTFTLAARTAQARWRASGSHLQNGS